MKEKIERNKQIYDEWKAGKISQFKLAIKYDITPSRVATIIKNSKLKQNG